jgi:hypothetical protein
MFVLSPFLNKGLITVYLQWSGEIPEDNDLLHK